MPQTTIRSKWTKFMEAYEAGNFLVSLGDGMLRHPPRLRGWNKPLLDAYLKDCNAPDLPRYVFADETRPIISSAQTIETIEVLKQFGKYRLPYPSCMAEYADKEPGVQIFSFVRERKYFDMPRLGAVSEYPFAVCLFALYDFRILKHTRNMPLKSDHFAVLYPILAGMENMPASYTFSNSETLTEKERAAGGVRFHSDCCPWLPVHVDESGLNEPVNTDALITEFMARAIFATRALTAMMQTRGIAREDVTRADVLKLNKHRAAKKQEPIPPHSYISLGFTTKKDGSTTPISTGAKLRFHSRAAHVKTQHYGPRNSLSKKILVDAYLVNENPHDALVVPTRLIRS